MISGIWIRLLLNAAILIVPVMCVVRLIAVVDNVMGLVLIPLRGV
jgi:hypothetical protein